MRGQVCEKNPNGNGMRTAGQHCDHNGKCCWCGESKDPKHGPFKPADWAPWTGGKRFDWVPAWRPYPYDTGGSIGGTGYPPGTIMCNAQHDAAADRTVVYHPQFDPSLGR